jgi:hypothetical protein
MGSVSALSAGAHTTALLVMADGVKGGVLASPPSPGWADSTIMMECTPESGQCHLCVLCIAETLFD